MASRFLFSFFAVPLLDCLLVALCYAMKGNLFSLQSVYLSLPAHSADENNKTGSEREEDSGDESNDRKGRSKTGSRAGSRAGSRVGSRAGMVFVFFFF